MDFLLFCISCLETGFPVHMTYVHTTINCESYILNLCLAGVFAKILNFSSCRCCCSTCLGQTSSKEAVTVSDPIVMKCLTILVRNSNVALTPASCWKILSLLLWWDPQTDCEVTYKKESKRTHSESNLYIWGLHGKNAQFPKAAKETGLEWQWICEACRVGGCLQREEVYIGLFEKSG